MSFLAPSLLWGLLAAAVPVIIHLISRRQTQRVDFSTVRFIKELEHDTIRKLKLRQIILLILRTVAVILLVLSFARPVKIGYFPLAGTVGQSTRIAMLFDNSATMAAEVERSTLLDRSKQTALNLLHNLEGDFTLDAYQTTPFKRVASELMTSMGRVREIFQNIQPTGGQDNLWTAIDSAIVRSEREEEISGQSANRELYVFSDFPLTVSDWKLTATAEWRTYLFLQPPVMNNLRVESAGVTSLLKMPNQLLTAETYISNSGGEVRKDVPVQLFFDDTRTGQVVSDFEPFDEKNFAFQAFAGEPGIVHGIIEIPEDDFTYDDRRFFQFRMTDQIRCAVIRQNETDGSLLKLALLALNRTTQVVELEEHLFGTVGATLLSDKDVVILLNPGELTSREIEALQEFVTDGGSALIFLGELLESSGGGNWLREFDLGTFTGTNRLAGENFLTVDRIALKHPLFSEFPATSLRDEMPQIFAHHRMKGFRRSQVILSLSNGEPFLTEKEVGSGRIILFSAPPDLAWTDLPVRGIFVPLLHRILIYLTSEVSGKMEVAVGDTLTIPISREDLSKEIVIRSPNGIKTKVVPDYSRERIIIENLDITGVYEVTLGGELFTTFVANLASTEDPSRRLEEDQLNDLFVGGSARVISIDEDPVLAVNEARRGTELWHIFLISGLVLLSAETWIGRVREE